MRAHEWAPYYRVVERKLNSTRKPMVFQLSVRQSSWENVWKQNKRCRSEHQRFNGLVNGTNGRMTAGIEGRTFHIHSHSHTETRTIWILNDLFHRHCRHRCRFVQHILHAYGSSSSKPPLDIILIHTRSTSTTDDTNTHSYKFQNL